MRPTPRLCLVVALGLLGCSSSEQPGVPEVKLNPSGATAATLQAELLLDRDEATFVTVSGSSELRLTFPQPVQPTELRVLGEGGIEVELIGGPTAKADGSGWRIARGEAGSATAFVLRLRAPSPARVYEVEVRGRAGARPPADPQELAAQTRGRGQLPFLNARSFAASPSSFTLHPRGSAAGEHCQTATVEAQVLPRTVRRAYLVYEANGVQRPVVLERSFAGRPTHGGLWLGGGEQVRTVVDELNPEEVSRSDWFRLCLPSDATAPVQVAEPRLVLELDSGLSPYDRDTARALAPALDARLDTAFAARGEEVELHFDRPIELTRTQLHLDRAGVPAVARAHGQEGWRVLAEAELDSGWNSLVLEGAAPLDELKVALGTAPRPDLPSANVAELELTASPRGRRTDLDRLVITYPPLRRDGTRWVAEHFDGTAYLSGWVQTALTVGEISVGGAPVGFEGQFATQVRRPAGTTGEWSTTLIANLVDGRQVSRTIHFTDDRSGELLAEQAGGSTAPEDLRFGRENQTAWGKVDSAAGGRVTLGTDVSFEAPPGAVSGSVKIGITRKGPESVPPLDPGMLNVTAPRHGAFRFLPAGQKFALPVKLTLPYDERLLPPGYSPEEVSTFFYDSAEGRWTALPRKQVLRASRQIVSESTHFTFMINAVLVEPEHPGVASFNPNSIKDLKAANPLEGLDLIAAPEANSDGTARLSLPIRLPPARGAYAPELALSYDSSGGSSWVGLGWDLSVPSIQLDTRLGVPLLEGDERYLFRGQTLIPVPSTGEKCVAGENARLYAPRVEREFLRIRRCGTGPESHYFEVTDKNGVLFLFGFSEENRLAASGSTTGHVGQWLLGRVIDLNDNLTEYDYQKDSKRTGPGATELDRHSFEPFTQAYLKEIRYSGRADRFGPGVLSVPPRESGPYAVKFKLEETDSATFAQRADVQLSARLGFKVVSRFLLRAVQVLGPKPNSIIREYVLHYASGDFDKTLLKKVELFGVGGEEDGDSFSQHGFDYSSADTSLPGSTEPRPLFGSPVKWSFGGGSDPSALTESKEWGLSANGRVSLAAEPTMKTSVGVSVSYGQRETSTHSSMVDINGDGLVDRLLSTPSGIRVLLNNPTPGAREFDDEAPPGDPASDVVSLRLPRGVASDQLLGSDRSRTIGVSAHATLGGVFSAEFGGSKSWSESGGFLSDADGDGLVDYLSGQEVLFNQPRDVCDPLDGAGNGNNVLCFNRTKTVALEAFEPLNPSDGGTPIANHRLADAGQALVAEATQPQDAVLEWTAPYDGKVDITGALSYLHPRPDGGVALEADGVELRVYHEGAPQASVSLAGNQTGSAPVQASGVSVLAGDRLHFVLSTRADVGLAVDDQGMMYAQEEVKFAPTIFYSECVGCPAKDYAEPAGTKVRTFNAAEDFRLGGEPLHAVHPMQKGKLQLDWSIVKKRSADELRVCIQRFAGDGATPAVPRSVPCSTHDSKVTPELSRTYGPGEEVSEPLTRTLEVALGQVLVFRVESDLAVDPNDLAGVVRGSYLEVCSKSGCRAPDPKLAESLKFEAEPYFPVHGNISGTPMAPLEVPRRGKLVVSSEASAAGPAPVFLAVRRFDEVLLKHLADGEPRSLSLEVQAGDSFFIEAHSERAFSLSSSLEVHLEEQVEEEVCWLEGGEGGKPVKRCELQTVTRRTPLPAAYQRTYDAPALRAEKPHPLPDDETGLPSDDQQERRTPSLLPGGYHGWRYGGWGGKSGEAFDPELYKAQQVKPLAGGSLTQEALRAAARDENSPERRRARLVGLFLPLENGTSQPGAPGLRPSPAFVSIDRGAFIGPGVMHASKRSPTPPRSSSAQVDARFAIGNLARTSTSFALSGGINLPIDWLIPGASEAIGFPLGASIGLSTGWSWQEADILDLNGDRIVDFVGAGPGNAYLTDLRTLRRRVRLREEVGLREGRDLGLNAGLGATTPLRNLTPKGALRDLISTTHRASSGVGVGINLSTSHRELMDFNADGLVDQVRWLPGNAQLAVRYNYGNGFAEHEDFIPLGGFDSAPGPVEKVTETLLVPGTFLTPPPDVPEEDRKEFEDLARESGSAGPLRKTASVSLNSNLGVGDEFWGASAVWDSTINSTLVMMLDVNGDGLPDHLRKSTFDKNRLHVRLNTGFGFAPSQQWEAPGWPGEALQPTFLLNPLNPAESPIAQPVQDALASLVGVDVSKGADTLEATGSHSKLPTVGASLTFTFPTPIGWVGITAGGNFTPEKTTGYELGFMDINGDGFADHVLKAPVPNPEPDLPAGAELGVYARLNQGEGGNRLVKVSRPLGSTLTLAYQATGNTVALPERRYVLTSVVEDEGSRANTKPGFILATTFEYEHPRYDRAEREFLGFEKVTRIRGDQAKVEQTYANTDLWHRGLLLSERTFDEEGRLLFESENRYGTPLATRTAMHPDCLRFRPFFLSDDNACRPLFVPLEATERREFSPGDAETAKLVTRQRYTFEPVYGNVTDFVDEGDVGRADDDHSAHVEYAHETDTAAVSSYFVSKARVLTVYAGQTSSGAVLRKREATYWSGDRGNLETLTVHLGDGAKATTSFEWDERGNLKKVTGPSLPGGAYVVAYDSYDAETQTYPAKVSDNRLLSSTTTMDLRFGRPVEVSAPSGQKTTWKYDDFGRLTEVRGPEDQDATVPTLAMAYHLGATATLRPYAVTRHKLEDRTSTLDTVILVDGLGRVLQTKKTAEVEGVAGFVKSGAQVLDLLGRPVQQGQPEFNVGSSTSPGTYAEAAMLHPTFTTYDALGRTTLVLEPGQSESGTAVLRRTAFTYGFGRPADVNVGSFRKVKVVDPADNTRVTYHDAGDRVAAVEEHLVEVVEKEPKLSQLTTHYGYSPLGELVSIVDAGKNPTSLSYDLAGRRKTLTSPDTGTTTWRYHPSGDLKEREDAAGRVVSYEYLLGRLERVKHSGTEVATYSYGLQGTNDAGRVTLVTDEAGWERRSYGPLGEVVKTVRQVRPLSPGAGPQEFTTEFDFDAFGRMQWIRYPDGETVSYAYDAGGLLFSATGSRPPSVSADAPSESYVRSIQYDKFGQRTRLVLGNGVETVYGYQPTTRRLSTLTTTTPAQRAIQQLAYGYDPVGNVLTLSNNLGPAYPGRAGATSYTFEYDSLYRLRYSKGAALARTGTVDVFESTFGYSNIHNLTRKWQRREVRRADSLEGVRVEVPDHSSYDWSYQYQGAGPHQVSQVADTSFGYDAAGNTLTECVMPPGTGTTCRNGNKYGQKTRRYQWADDGTLKGVVYPGEGRIVRFLYDSGGQRVAKLGRGEPNLSIGQWYGQKGGVFYTKHIFAGATRVASRLEKVQESAAPAEVTAPLLASAGCLGCAAAVQAAPAPPSGPWHEATFYYHQDHLGSTSWLTDQYGRPRERVEYFPYGEVWRDEKEGGELGPPGVDRFLFTGKQLDEETGLTYFGARYYDSKRARWISPDPESLRQAASGHIVALNPYEYGALNPLRFLDPDGRCDGDTLDEGVAAACARRQQNQQVVPEMRNQAAPVVNAVSESTPLGVYTTARDGKHPNGQPTEGWWDRYGSAVTSAAGIAAATVIVGVAKMTKNFAKALANSVKIGDQPFNRAFNVGESACRTGCEDVAKKIFEVIGGDIKKITPKYDANVLGGVKDIGGSRFLDPSGGAGGWAEHQFVLKDGIVFDALTGPKGQPLADYKARWEFPDFIDWGD